MCSKITMIPYYQREKFQVANYMHSESKHWILLKQRTHLFQLIYNIIYNRFSLSSKRIQTEIRFELINIKDLIIFFFSKNFEFWQEYVLNWYPRSKVNLIATHAILASLPVTIRRENAIYNSQYLQILKRDSL